MQLKSTASLLRYGLLLGLGVLLPTFIYAAGIVPCDGVKVPCTVDHLFTLLINVYNFLLGMAGLVAMLVIVYGGILMLLSFLDSGKSSYIESGKNYVRGGITGLVIIACAYLIVNTLIVLLGGGGLAPLFQRLLPDQPNLF